MATKLSAAAQRATDRAEPDPRLVHRTHHRLEWLKRALQADVPDRAKTLASALSVKWANDQTGQCNPSLRELCAFLGWNKDKARRAIADLIEGGLLERVVGKGRGRKSGYMFLGPSNVVSLPSPQAVAKVAESPRADPEKRSQICTNQKAAKGSTGAAKRSQKCTPLYKDEHTMEHTKAETGCAGDDVSEAFERLWKAYPRPTDRLASMKIFAEKVEKGIDPELIISRAPRAKKHRSEGSDGEHYFGLKRWLEQTGWEHHVTPIATQIDQNACREAAIERRAGWVIDRKGWAPKCINPTQARELLELGRVTSIQLREAGVHY